MSRSLVCLLLLSLTCMAQAQSVDPDDFAFGMPLEVDGDGALYHLELPGEVYRYSTRPDHGDLRIFNGYGEVIPHLLRSAYMQKDSLSEPVALPFFPLMKSLEQSTGLPQTHIATDERGKVISFWQRGRGLQEGVIGRYLIDASALGQPLEGMLLDWEIPAEDFLMKVVLEASNDLANWHSLEIGTSLVSMQQGAYHLRQGEIPIPDDNQYKYYRLNWPLGEMGTRLTSIRGVLQHQGSEKKRRWLRYSPIRDRGEVGVYEFLVEGYYPVDRARIILPQPNTAVRARLLSSSDRDNSLWQERYGGLFYKLRRDGQEISSDVVKVGPVEDRHWKLVIEGGADGFDGLEPLLELGWLPQRVYFVARGETPYILAFAAAGVAGSEVDIGELRSTLEQSSEGEGIIKTAVTGSMYELGGQQRLQAFPLTQPWLIWMLLLTSVLIVALMARSLYRKANSNNRLE